ncbi:MAG: DMT family transporter [Treponema sp.]|nr:DMT family transporter [Treponema sp.]
MTRHAASFFAGAGLLLTAGIWGFGFVVVKDSLDYVGPLYMVAFRFSIAAVALTALLWQSLKETVRRDIFDGALLGIFLCAAFVFQTIGCKYTTAGKNAFLTTIYVLLVPLFAWGLYRRRPPRYVFIAAFLSVVGIGLLALTPGADSLLTVQGGDVLTLICGVFYALHIIYMEKCNRENRNPILLTVLQFLFVALFSWVLAPVIDGAIPLHAIVQPRVVASMLYLGIFSTLVCFLLQNIGLKYVSSSFASLLLSCESVFGVLFSVILLHEAVTLRMACGCVLIFCAVILTQTKFDFRFKRKAL